MPMSLVFESGYMSPIIVKHIITRTISGQWKVTSARYDGQLDLYGNFNLMTKFNEGIKWYKVVWIDYYGMKGNSVFSNIKHPILIALKIAAMLYYIGISLFCVFHVYL
jgi:hypothetical protein